MKKTTLAAILFFSLLPPLRAQVNTGGGMVTAPTANTVLGIYNVRDYGARGDGVTDDSAAIRAAIAALPVTGNAGGIIWVPPGRYIVNSTLSFNGRRNWRLTGASGGNSSIYDQSPEFRWGGAAGSGSMITAAGANGWEIDHLGLTYSSAAYDGDLISLDSFALGSDCTIGSINHCRIRGWPGATSAASLICLRLTNTLVFEKNILTLAAKGIRCSGTSNNNITIRDNLFDRSFTVAAIAAWGTNWQIDGNTFESDPAAGVAHTVSFIAEPLGGVRTVSFTNNLMLDGGSGGGSMVKVGRVAGMRIESNSFTAASGNGIEFDADSWNIAVKANTVSGISRLALWTGGNHRQADFGNNYFGSSSYRGGIYKMPNNAVDLPLTQNVDVLLPQGMLTVSCFLAGGSNGMALFAINGATHFVSKLVDDSSIFSVAKGTAGKINVYWDAGSNQYNMENKIAADWECTTSWLTP